MQIESHRVRQLVLICIQEHLTLSYSQVRFQEGGVRQIPGTNVQEPGDFVQCGYNDSVTIYRPQNATDAFEFGLVRFAWNIK